MDKHIGQELGVSDWVTIDQSRIDTFASCTGDHQWIHVDVDRAQRESPYGRPVAHGYLTLSMVGPLSMQIGIVHKDSSAGLNYGIDKVRFLAPVPAGGRVRLNQRRLDPLEWQLASLHWSGRAWQEDFDELVASGLASMYQTSDWSLAPGRHGY